MKLPQQSLIDLEDGKCPAVSPCPFPPERRGRPDSNPHQPHCLISRRVWWSVLQKFKSRGTAQSLSHVWIFVTPWTEAHQASMTISSLDFGVFIFLIISDSLCILIGVFRSLMFKVIIEVVNLYLPHLLLFFTCCTCFSRVFFLLLFLLCVFNWTFYTIPFSLLY